MWKISKTFQLPLSDPRIQSLSRWDLEFYEYSMIADDPKKLERLKNYFYDPEYDEWLQEVDDELNGIVKDDKVLPDYSEYEVSDENDSEINSKVEENSDEENPNQEDLESNLSNSEDEIDEINDDFVPMYEQPLNSEIINDWEEVD